PTAPANPGAANTAAPQTGTDPTSQIGADLFQLVRRAQAAGVDAEAALRGRARELDEQIRTAELTRPGRTAPPSRTRRVPTPKAAFRRHQRDGPSRWEPSSAVTNPHGPRAGRAPRRLVLCSGVSAVTSPQ